MFDPRITSKRFNTIRQASYNLNQILIVTTRSQTTFDGSDEMVGRPRDIFRGFDDDRISCEEGGDNGGEGVVKSGLSRGS